ncbi:SdpI family protein [Adhaeribacter aquaticus]|uniref:SdpI family protein n=1 Tax=Adhaeribacter aquaticus TaxID=299567 RepID=UPI000414796D|nr:SdpI family protein [Adhaeribacter aquaticus]
MPDQKWFRKESLRLLILGLPFIFLIIFWEDFLDSFPIHWNFDGQVDRYGNKMVLLFFACLNAGIYGIFVLAPRFNVSPELNLADHDKYLNLIQTLVHLLLTYVFFLVGFMALGYDIKAELAIKYGLISLFLVSGTFIGQIPRNKMVGLRLPWTLRNEQIWQRTHYFTGLLWVYSSLFMLIYNFWETKYTLAFPAYLTLLIAAPIVYSYVLYKRAKNY